MEKQQFIQCVFVLRLHAFKSTSAVVVSPTRAPPLMPELEFLSGVFPQPHTNTHTHTFTRIPQRHGSESRMGASRVGREMCVCVSKLGGLRSHSLSFQDSTGPSVRTTVPCSRSASLWASSSPWSLPLRCRPSQWHRNTGSHRQWQAR